MILVNCVWRQEDIIKAVESVKVDDKNVFRSVKVEGFRMFFETIVDDMQGIKMIKAAIKEIPGYEALFIDIVPVVNDNVFEGYNKLLYK
ncbi:hypothetical protein CDLVIII_4466 [Clostridium sp. DL-VIII]|uniref:hypothetical protein n=1 Tax=Clostridium sp. DL-VIII TaxID=641107 RepID=UPI00023B06D6|nr:hypothetical protein [Clostridium sp. DL-VIII]EHJ00977.1 hypothetical protein CDLVIII_4466 [Clostridium sp. DL-VIII]